MKDTDINSLRDNHIKSFEKELKSIYLKFTVYPTEVRIALFDMIFNLGQPKLKKYKKLKTALDKEDWAKCATESKRKGIQPSRNKYVKDLFNKAAKNKKAAAKNKKKGKQPTGGNKPTRKGSP